MLDVTVECLLGDKEVVGRRRPLGVIKVVAENDAAGGIHFIREVAVNLQQFGGDVRCLIDGVTVFGQFPITTGVLIAGEVSLAEYLSKHVIHEHGGSKF